ncbi:MAG: DUF5717 family protein [Roseburia sp.]|nr:DUF5717 family protein [Roseburia sp.]MCM1243218.1 DUF5717 family protein [Roseburia sp.]
MKQIIQEILAGNFMYDNGSLDFSCPQIELSAQAGEVLEGSFTIYGPEGVLTEGSVVSSDLRMECMTPTFAGSQDEIFYRLDTFEMEAGTEIKGAFHIVSNQGEYYLPFSVSIKPSEIDSSLGIIKNLFHFTNLAKSSWDEAVKLFYSKEFEQVFKGNDRQHYTAYRGLSAHSGNEHNVEEFLIEINKKKAVEFIPEQTQIKIENPAPLSRYTLVINRNGWGYTNLRIETEGDFLEIHEEVVTDDAFLGNLYRLYYYIKEEGLHAGNNYGAIRLSGYDKSVTVPVTVSVHARDDRRKAGLYKEKKRIIAQLMQFYQAFRLKKISVKTWMEETGKLTERLQEIDGKDAAAALFQAQLLMTRERFHEAQWILEQNREQIEAMQDEKPELWCYYLYLTTLHGRNDAYIDEVSRIITRYYERNRGNWRIAWLLLFVSEEYGRSASVKWALLEELFTYRCRSPLMYIEAWNLLCMNPAMLLKLGDFELQVLNYAIKSEVMKDDIIIQLLYLAQKQKGYSPLLLRILAACYDTHPQNDILHAICTTLIKGNKYGSDYFEWYRAGVEQNLRITRLYEYYMMSVTLDDARVLPKMVLMYFSYQSDLNYEITAWLYAYVLKHQEEIPDVYLNYLPAMERFVTEQIRKGRINKNLAYLYRNVLTKSMVDEEVAQKLMDLLFMRDIEIEDDSIRQVILVYPYGTGEMAYPAAGGCAQVPVFDEECRIILEDADHNRYTKSIPYRMEHLNTTGKLILMAAPYVREHPGYDLYVCFDHKDILAIQEDTIGRFKRLADSDFMSEQIRREIRIKLMQFYYEKDRMWELDEYLYALKPEQIAAGDRKEVVRTMVLRGMYQEAYEWIRYTGPYGIDVKTLVKLCSRLLGSEEFEPQRLMTGILLYVLKKGKYDEQILQYLVRYYNGSIKDMRDIWKAAHDFGVDTYEMSERILVQMLYTGAYIGESMEILRSYRKESGKEEVVLAFLSQCCYDHVIKEKIAEPLLFEDILRLYREKADLHLVCRIAYLKYYAENPKEITEEIKEVIRAFLRELLKKQIVLPLFNTYQGYLPELDALQDKVILEYRAQPGHRVMIHYLIQKEGGDKQDYNKEVMKDMFSGICVKEFILFFGERLQYYITEEADGKEQVTQSGAISKNDSRDDAPSSSRFSLLNDIMIGRTLQDYDTVDKLLEEYYKKDFMVDRLFTVI